MKRWTHIAGYVLAVVTELALIAGSWILVDLSTHHMMVSRYLIAKNVLLEQSWFSPLGELAQTAALLLIGVGLVVAAAILLRRGARFAALQAALCAAPAVAGAYLLQAVSTDALVATHALVIAAWIVLLIQVVVAGLAARAARRRF